MRLRSAFSFLLAATLALGTGWSARAQSAETVTLSPAIVPVGKWAEGVAFDGRSLWVAESGQRSIAQIDFAAGKLIRRVSVGRLPVGMAADGATVYALLNTDKKLWRQTGANGGVIASLGGCPEALATGGGTVWVLSQPDCSSAAWRLFRVDASTGRAVAAPVQPGWASAIALAAGRVWVAQVDGTGLVVVDAATQETAPVDMGGASLWAIAAAGRTVYAGGRMGDDNSSGIVVAIDAVSQREIARQPVDERVQAIVADTRYVVAVGERGSIWVFAAGSLDLLKRIELATGPIQARSAIFAGDDLVVTNQQAAGENGAVVILGGWRD